MGLPFGMDPVELLVFPLFPSTPLWPCTAPSQAVQGCWVQQGLYVLQGMSENTLARPQGFVPS